MHVLITGASGFIGQKLARTLLLETEGSTIHEAPLPSKIRGQVITALTLTDIHTPPIPSSSSSSRKSNHASIQITTLPIDITDFTSFQNMLRDSRPDVIFHLAAVVSGQAESNFELGYRVNVDASRNLLEAIRLMGHDYKPRLVFSSSIAVFGPPLPDVVPDAQATTPRGCYGTQKAIVELLVEDYSRRGYVDGITIRFPTIVIRPGKPNKAASSFLSGMVREPLHGMECTVPVDLELRHPIASPEKAVEYLLVAAALNPQQAGDRTINVPGLSLSVGEMLEAFRRVAGEEIAKRIKLEPDPFLASILETWPKEFVYEKATRLGFVPDKSYEDIIRAYMMEYNLTR